MKLEAQLETLAGLGLPLADGIEIDDVLYSFERSDYEKEPFGLVLFVLGIEVEREPWGRFVCERAWNFDTECINGPGDYVSIVNNLCRVAGASERVANIADHVDMATGEAWLEYTCDGKARRWTVEVNDDWADTMTTTYVMDDIESDGKRFYYKDNGQAMVLFYLDEASAKTLLELSPTTIEPVVPS